MTRWKGVAGRGGTTVTVRVATTGPDPSSTVSVTVPVPTAPVAYVTVSGFDEFALITRPEGTEQLETEPLTEQLTE